MCERVFCIWKPFRIFVCILCFKRMLPGNFQVSVMSKHSGFAVNLFTWAKPCRSTTRMVPFNLLEAKSPHVHQHPSGHQSYLQHVWDKCENFVIFFLKRLIFGIFSGSQCCLFLPVYVCVLKVNWIFLKWFNPRGHCASESHHISRNAQRN